ncbi:MAG: hypothetical protein WBN89_02630 [Prochlorococcaceae cyanobacterium]
MSHHPPARVAPRSNRPQLPAFCRTRRPTVTVSVSGLAALQRLVLLVLVFQLSTLLLVIAGPVPPVLTPGPTWRRSTAVAEAPAGPDALVRPQHSSEKSHGPAR